MDLRFWQWGVMMAGMESDFLPEYGVFLESRSHRQDDATAVHEHPFASLLLVVSGYGTCTIGPKQYELSPNMVIALAKNTSHQLRDKPRQQMTVFALYYSKEISSLNTEINQFLNETAEPFQLPVYYAEQLRRTLRQMLYEQNTRPPGYELALQHFLGLIGLGIYRAKLQIQKFPEAQEDNNSTLRVKRVLEYIAIHYHERHSLSNAAKMSCLSQRQFTTRCKKVTGTSLVPFLNRIRTTKAKELLEKKSMAIAAAAFEVGYEDLSTFYRAFKKYLRITPTELKRTAPENCKP